MTLSKARQYGIVASSTWARLASPGEEQVSEVISIDLWTDPAQMSAYYELGLGFDEIGKVFAAPPETSTWQSAAGWTEW